MTKRVDNQILSPTSRTKVARGNRAWADRAELYQLLDHAVYCHLAVVVDGLPLAVPTIFAYDQSGPDNGGTLYLHGSVAARSIASAPEQDVLVTVTLLDGLVLARAAFHHSMNYRSAVIIGRPRLVVDDEEREIALKLIVDQLIPGRTQYLRAHSRKELAATSVLALPLLEASVKMRQGGPQDDSGDVREGGVWAGVLPVSLRVGKPIASVDLEAGVEVPSHVRQLVRAQCVTDHNK
ncbi:MAG: pyridoxamine 5'-phosphate oxidase family protein [Mycobacteriaceae bacterium]